MNHHGRNKGRADGNNISITKQLGKSKTFNLDQSSVYTFQTAHPTSGALDVASKGLGWAQRVKVSGQTPPCKSQDAKCEVDAAEGPSCLSTPQSTHCNALIESKPCYQSIHRGCTIKHSRNKVLRLATYICPSASESNMIFNLTYSSSQHQGQHIYPRLFIEPIYSPSQCPESLRQSTMPW